MPHARDDGHREGVQRPRDALVVERPQVLDAAAPAGDDRDIDIRFRGERSQRTHDARRGLVALHERR